MNLFAKKNRVLMQMLVKTDFKLRYQDSALGMAWSLLNPLMLFAIMYIVFDKFFGMGRMAGVEHFPVQLLLGIVAWQFFEESTNIGMTSIAMRGDLLRKINFPKPIIVISGTISSLINLLLSLIVLIIFAAFNHVQFTWRIILFPVSLLELYIFALAFSFFLAALYVKFKDIGHIWSVFLRGWMYATPIIYPLALVANFSVPASKVLLLFPPAQIIQDMRYEVVSQQVQTVWNYVDIPYIQLVPILMIVMLSLLSVWYFKRASKTFAEEI